MPLLLLKELPRFECLLHAATRYPDLDPSATSAFLHLLHTSDHIADSEAHTLAQFSLSQGRFSLLMLLNRTPDTPQTPASLADQAGVSRATVTGLLDTLEKDDLIARSADLHDRRLTLVHLTPKGTALMDSVLPPYFQHVSALLSPLSAPEREQLIGLLQKIIQGLQRATPTSSPTPP